MTFRKTHFFTKSTGVIAALLSLTLFVSCGQKQNKTTSGEMLQTQLLSADSIRSVVSKFSQAVSAKDTAMLKQSVSEHFAVATVTWPTSKRYMQQIFMQPQIIDSIVPIPESIVGIKNSFKQKVAAIIYFNGKEPVKTSIALDGRSNKVVYVDYLDSLYAVFRNKPAQLVSIMPIDTVGGFIMINLRSCFEL